MSVQSDQLQPYNYSPLESPNHTRLIYLQPGLTPEIHCEIYHFDIDNLPQSYHALSYVWGTDYGSDVVICDGDRSIPITSNLKAALLQFRQQERVVEIWVDAIAINQNDNREREQQVQLMGQIYGRAYRVDIWLGEEDELTKPAFASLHLIVQIMDEVGLNYLDDDAVGVLASSSEKFPSPASPEMEGILNLFQRTWFDRAWTFQESVLARIKHIYCGSSHIDAIRMGKICQMLYTLGKTRGTIGSGNKYVSATTYIRVVPCLLWAMAHRMSDDFETYQLLNLLEARPDAEASLARDHIYSLLAVATDIQHERLIPNYSESVTDEDVFVDFAHFSIRNRGDLRILRSVDVAPGSSSFPSWVPDWGRRSRTYSPLSRVEINQYIATGTSQPGATQGINIRHLHAQGLDCGKIIVLTVTLLEENMHMCQDDNAWSHIV